MAIDQCHIASTVASAPPVQPIGATLNDHPATSSSGDVVAIGCPPISVSKGILSQRLARSRSPVPGTFTKIMTTRVSVLR